MRPFLDQLKATLDCGIWSPVVLGLLVIPDACGAVEYPQLGNGDRYKNWFNKYVGSNASHRFKFDGEVLWKLRNAMMHETSLNLSAYGYDRIFFALPNRQNNVFYMNLMKNSGSTTETVLNIYLPTFFNEMRAGAEKWLVEIESDHNPNRRSLIDKLIQFRPAGLHPHFVGIPTVA